MSRGERSGLVALFALILGAALGIGHLDLSAPLGEGATTEPMQTSPGAKLAVDEKTYGEAVDQDAAAAETEKIVECFTTRITACANYHMIEFVRAANGRLQLEAAEIISEGDRASRLSDLEELERDSRRLFSSCKRAAQRSCFEKDFGR